MSVIFNTRNYNRSYMCPCFRYDNSWSRAKYIVKDDTIVHHNTKAGNFAGTVAHITQAPNGDSSIDGTSIWGGYHDLHGSLAANYALLISKEDTDFAYDCSTVSAQDNILSEAFYFDNPITNYVVQFYEDTYFLSGVADNGQLQSYAINEHGGEVWTIESDVTVINRIGPWMIRTNDADAQLAVQLVTFGTMLGVYRAEIVDTATSTQVYSGMLFISMYNGHPEGAVFLEGVNAVRFINCDYGNNRVNFLVYKNNYDRAQYYSMDMSFLHSGDIQWDGPWSDTTYPLQYSKTHIMSSEFGSTIDNTFLCIDDGCTLRMMDGELECFVPDTPFDLPSAAALVKPIITYSSSHNVYIKFPMGVNYMFDFMEGTFIDVLDPAEDGYNNYHSEFAYTAAPVYIHIDNEDIDVFANFSTINGYYGLILMQDDQLIGTNYEWTFVQS